MPTSQQPFQIYGTDPVPPMRDTSALSQADQYTPSTQVPASVIAKGSPLLAEGAAALRENNREKAGFGESFGAAASQWVPMHAYDAVNTPSFTPDPEFQASKFIRQVPFALRFEDEQFISKAVSAEDAQHRVETIDARNSAQAAMGDNPFISFIGMALDPTYLGIDVASMGATRLLRGGKLMAGGIAAGMTAGVLTAESQVVPVSNTEIVLGSMMMGAASGMFFRGGKLQPRDANFPARALNDVVEDLRVRDDLARETEAVKREVVIERKPEPARVEPEVVPQRDVSMRPDPGAPRKVTSGRALLQELVDGSDALLSTMAKRISEVMIDDVEVRTMLKKDMPGPGREHYDPAQHAVYLSRSSEPEVKLHEMTHAVTAHKLEYGLKNPTSAHGKIVQEIESLRLSAREAYKKQGGKLNATKQDNTAYYLDNAHEFVAGVFTGKSAFTELLAGMKVEGSTKTVLGSMIGAIRRILGMGAADENALIRTIGLTEELMGTKLNTTIHNAMRDAPGSFSVRAAPPSGTTAQILKTMSKAKDVAHAVEWSWHKSFGKFSPKAAEIADILMDSPTSTATNSAASIQRALRADLAKHQYSYEGALLDAMSARGAGLLQRITKTREAVKVQQSIERDVYAEMIRRHRAATDGVSIQPHADPAVAKMADALDALSSSSLKELQAAGVTGAKEVTESAGYVTRRWDISKMESIESKLIEGGATPKQARQQIVDTISIGIQRANGWDAEVAGDVAGTIFDRTKRRGMFQDAEFHSFMGEDASAKLRSLLSAEGLAGARLDRVMQVLEGKADEAGKLPTLKNRVDMHMDESVTFNDGSTASILDMLDTNVSAITERYLDSVSAKAALAQKGLTNPSDITAMRNALAQSIDDVAQRAEAVKSFDEMLNVLQGNPVGEEMLSGIRNIQAVTQMVGLAKSGLWQLTEYSTIMSRYGATATMKSLLKEMPFVRDMVKHHPDSLREVLSRNSAQDTRLRPFINRMEDNFDIPMSDAVKLSLMQAKQLVPYANAMKFIQRHQARTSANLIVDTIVRATKGDAKAMSALEGYGLESGTMMKVSGDIRTHGMDTAKWSHDTWNEVRAPLTKMMDDAVLRARLGEIPQFAHTSTLGKFLFTFRSFTLAAHNKVLAKTLNDGGYSGLGLLLAYQIPMTVLATQVGTGLSGKPQGDMQDTIEKAFGQVGALGLFTEAFGIVSGQKQQFGSPGLIAADRMYKVIGAASSGDAGNTAAAVLNTVPILSSFLPTKALGEALKSDNE